MRENRKRTQADALMWHLCLLAFFLFDFTGMSDFQCSYPFSKSSDPTIYRNPNGCYILLYGVMWEEKVGKRNPVFCTNKTKLHLLVQCWFAWLKQWFLYENKMRFIKVKGAILVFRLRAFWMVFLKLNTSGKKYVLVGQ